VAFTGADDESVELVEEPGIARELGLEEGADLLVRAARAALGAGTEEPMTAEKTAGVGVNNKDGMVAGIEEDGVGGFRPDAAEREELFTQNVRGRCEKGIERAFILFKKEGDEGFEGLRFLAEVAGGAKVGSEPGGANFCYCGGREQFCGAKIGDGALYILPRGVLGKNGADDDFKAGTAGPPMLRAVSRKEGIEVGI
jgi:hypothetical protein